MPITLEKAITGFLDFIRFQKRYSKHTFESYQNDLKSFNGFVAVTFEVDEVHLIKSPHVRTWLASLKENDYSAKSINRKISSLKSFFKYHLKTGGVETSPMGMIVSPKIGKRLPQFVDQSHIKTLFDHVEFSDGFTGLTEKLVMNLLYHTGMRQAELLALKDESIDKGNRLVKVVGKGNKERVIPVNPELAESIDSYIKERNRLYGKTQRLLVTKNGSPLYPKYVYALVKKYLSLVTTIDKKSPHVLRHTFATHLTGNGADLNAVKELLGHSSLAATQVYTHNSIERLKDIHSRAHPKS